jgi:hypothetical protein
MSVEKSPASEVASSGTKQLSLHENPARRLRGLSVWGAFSRLHPFQNPLPEPPVQLEDVITLVKRFSSQSGPADIQLPRGHMINPT